MRGTNPPAGHRTLLRDLGCAALAAAFALAVAAVVLKLWDAKLHIPLSGLHGDATGSFMAVKMLVAGSWFHNDLIGAPAGTDLQDFPFYWDLGQILAIKGVGLFFSDPARTFNAVYVLSYPAIAFNAFVALRWTGARRGPAVVVAVLFATLPFHFLRGQAHFFIGQYWAVPFSTALVYKLIAGHPLVAGRPAGGNVVTRWLSGTTIATLAAGIATGIQFSYFAIFTLILIVLVAVIRFVAVPRRATLVDPVVAFAFSSAAFVLMLVPTLLYRYEHGTNVLVARRVPQQAEYFGLKLAHLLLPISGHRIGSFDRKAIEYATTAPVCGECKSSALGLLFGLALVLAILSVAVAAVRTTPVRGQAAVLRASGLGALLCFLLGTVGGGSSLFAYLISSQLRGWTRISILLAFFAAIALAAILTWLLYELRGGRGVAVTVIVLTVVGVLGVLDQTSPKWAPNYTQNFQTWGSDARFVKQIEQQVPHGAKILQLPHWPFPEMPARARAVDYDLFRPMFHSKHLRWSYGAMRGRSADWGAESLADQPLKEVLPKAVAAGFAGVYVDTFTYADNGTAVLAELAAASGETPSRSDDGRMAFVSLTPLAARVKAACSPAALRRAGNAFVHPADITWGRGFHEAETDGPHTWHWARSAATLTVGAGRDPASATDVTFSLRASTSTPQTVTVQVGNAAPKAVTIPVAAPTPGTAPVSLTIPPGGGATRIRLRTDAPDDGRDVRDLRMRVDDVRVSSDLACAAS